MSFLFANEWAAAVLFIIGVLAILAGLGMLLKGSSRRENGQVIAGVLVALIGVAALFGWYWSSTHFVVGANERAIVVSKQTGEVSPYVLAPGVQHIAWNEQYYTYPAQTLWQWAFKTQPSTASDSQPISINASFIFTIDASQVAWASQYRQFNVTSGDSVTNAWLNAGIRSAIAQAVSPYKPSELTTKRFKVEASIFNAVKPIMDSIGVPLISVSLVNWNYDNADLAAQMDSSAASLAKIEIARNEQSAAQIQVQTAQLKRQQCDAMGFTDQDACLGYLQLVWLSGLPQLPSNFVLSLGPSTNTGVTFPVAAPPTAVPTK